MVVVSVAVILSGSFWRCNGGVGFMELDWRFVELQFVCGGSGGS